MEITIAKRDKDSISLFAYTDKSYYPLFQFEYRDTEDMGGPAWYFWLRGDYDPDIFKGEKKDFPMEFFVSACKAKAFIRHGVSLSEEVTIVKGKNYLSR